MTSEFKKKLIDTFSKEGLFVRYDVKKHSDLFDKWFHIKSVGYLAEPINSDEATTSPGFIFTAKNVKDFGDEHYHISRFDTSVYRKYPEKLVGLTEMPSDGKCYAKAAEDFFLECDSDGESKTMLLVAKEGLFYPMADNDEGPHVLKKTEMGPSDYPIEEEVFWEYFSIQNPDQIPKVGLAEKPDDGKHYIQAAETYRDTSDNVVIYENYWYPICHDEIHGEEGELVTRIHTELPDYFFLSDIMHELENKFHVPMTLYDVIYELKTRTLPQDTAGLKSITSNDKTYARAKKNYVQRNGDVRFYKGLFYPCLKNSNYYLFKHHELGDQHFNLSEESFNESFEYINPNCFDNVVVKIPPHQVEIIMKALDASIRVFYKNDDNNQYRLFDILVLKALFNKTELLVDVPGDIYRQFTAINGVDFPYQFPIVLKK